MAISKERSLLIYLRLKGQRGTFDGDSNIQTDQYYICGFAMMYRYINNLNKEKSPNMAIQANTVNFGDSCKGHPKKLTVYYKCIRNDPKNNILNYLTTKDNKSTHSTVILENQ